jgi:hypothetical protein
VNAPLQHAHEPCTAGPLCILRDASGARAGAGPVQLDLLPSGVEQVVVCMLRGPFEHLPAATRNRLRELVERRPAQRWRPLAWWWLTPLRRALGPIARDGELHRALCHAIEGATPVRGVVPVFEELRIERLGALGDR